MRSPVSEVTTKTSNITVQLTPYVDSITKSHEDALNRGFKLFHASPHTVLGIGSTFSNKESDGPSRVLDGAAIKPIVDRDNVIIGYVQATADGLGHGDDNFNNEVAQMSNVTTEYIADQVANYVAMDGFFTEDNLKSLLAEAGVHSYQQVYGDGANKFHRSKAQSSVAVTVALNIDGQITLINAGVGDLMSLVVNPVTLEVLSSVNARQFESKTPDRNVVYIPESAQSLAYEKKDRLQIETLTSEDNKAQFSLSAGLYSFHLSDGIHDYLPTQSHVQKLKEDISVEESESTKVNVVKLDHEKISEQLQQKLGYSKASRKTFSKHEVGQALNAIALEALLEERQQKIQIQPLIKKAVDLMNKVLQGHVNTELGAKNSKKKPFQIVKDYKIEQFMLDLNSGVEEGVYGIDQQQFSQECVAVIKKFYDKSNCKGCQAVAFIVEMNDEYKEQSGDDATFSAIEIPTCGVELVRAWCEHGDNCEGLNNRIQKQFTSVAEINTVFSILAAEFHLPQREDGHDYNSELVNYYSDEYLQRKKTQLLLEFFYDDVTVTANDVLQYRMNLIDAWCGYPEGERRNHQIQKHLTSVDDVDCVFSALAVDNKLLDYEIHARNGNELINFYSYEYFLHKKTQLLLQFFYGGDIENLIDSIISECDQIANTSLAVKIQSLGAMARKKPDFEAACSLVATRDVLKNPSIKHVNHYLAYADTLKGAPSTNKQVLVGIFAAIGITLLVTLSVVALAFSYGAATPVFIGLASGGGSSCVLGAGLSFLSRRKGLSKNVYNLGVGLKASGIFAEKESGISNSSQLDAKAEVTASLLSTI